jgi:hypothetical protein
MNKTAAYMYSASEVTDINKDESIPFNENGYIKGAIGHKKGSAKILIKTRGMYRVTYMVNTTQEAIFGLIVNDRLIASSLANTPGGSKAVGQAIVQFESGDCLELRNCTGGPITLEGFAGGIERNVRASILLHMVDT